MVGKETSRAIFDKRTVGAVAPESEVVALLTKMTFIYPDVDIVRARDEVQRLVDEGRLVLMDGEKRVVWNPMHPVLPGMEKHMQRYPGKGKDPGQGSV